MFEKSEKPFSRLPLLNSTIKICNRCRRNLLSLNHGFYIYKDDHSSSKVVYGPLWLCQTCKHHYISKELSRKISISYPGYHFVAAYYCEKSKIYNVYELVATGNEYSYRILDSQYSTMASSSLQQEAAQQIAEQKAKAIHQESINLYKKFKRENFAQNRSVPVSVPVPKPTPVESSVLMQTSKFDHVIVYKEMCHCHSCLRRHLPFEMISRTLVVDSTLSCCQEILINVFECSSCGRIYINDLSLKQYEKRHGILFLERHYGSDNDQGSRREIFYNNDSILSRCGYRAQPSDSDRERQSVLRFIMDSGKATKAEIVEMLSFLLRDRGDRCFEARYKWEKDIDYTNNYNVKLQKHIYGLRFRQ